jgi:hypothetical protein
MITGASDLAVNYAQSVAKRNALSKSYLTILSK